MAKVAGFGEIMVRLQPPGYLKFIQASSFQVSYAGAEANVMVFLSRMGYDTDFITKLPESEISDALAAKLLQHGVGLDHVLYGGDRIGLYYLERGVSQRPSKVIYDRKYSSISQVKRSEFDWDNILEGVDWFHFTGITAALSDEMPEICEEACCVARSKGITVSCDLNYRTNLWHTKKASEVMSRLAHHVDVIIGNEEDAETCLGIGIGATDLEKGALDLEAYERAAKRITAVYGANTVAFTLRQSLSASINRWGALLYHNDKTYYSREYEIYLVDRVGGGDSFSGGLIYALLEDYGPQEAIEFAVAASCLKQTMEMDFNLASFSDIYRLMEGDGSGRVQR